MRLPTLEHPERYCGLYVFDFGEWTAVGYTADEIATLLESEQYRSGRIYKIARAMPDGYMELRGVAPERFQLESGLFFTRETLDAARRDFAELCHLAEQTPPPCRAFVHLADRGQVGGLPAYVTALIYPAEYEEEVAAWLLTVGYSGGDLAEGGISHVTDYYAQEKRILERQQLWSRAAIPSRCREELLRTVRRVVQR
jgi:hypothetical protein